MAHRRPCVLVWSLVEPAWAATKTEVSNHASSACNAVRSTSPTVSICRLLRTRGMQR